MEVIKRKRATEAERLMDQNKDLKTPVRVSRRITQTSLSKYVLDVRQRISDIPSVELDNIYAKIKEENSKITENITQEKVTEVYNNILSEINKLFNIFSKNKSTDFSKTISFIAGLYKQILEKSKELPRYNEIEKKIKNNISKIGDIVKGNKNDPLYQYYREYTSQIKEKENTKRTERTERDVLDVLDGLLESFGNISLTTEPKTEKSKTSPKSSNLTNKVKQARLEDIRGKITELRRNNTELKSNITELRRKLNLINKELTSLIREKEALEEESEEEIDDQILYNKKQRNQIEEGDGMSTGGSKNKSKSKPKSKSKSKKNKEKSLIEKVKTLFKF
jgi:cell division protein ZapA